MKRLGYMTDEAYNRLEGLRNTDISYLMKSAADYAAYKTRGFKETEAMHFGKAVHMAILEPAEFKKRAIVAPFDSFRTKESKAWLEANATKLVLTQDEMAGIYAIADAIGRSDTFKSFKIIGTEIAFQSDIGGTIVKCKADIEAESAILDIKTTTDANPYGFTSSVVKYGYHRQAALYKAITGKEMIFVAVEKKDPYKVGFYRFNDDTIKQGMAEIEIAIDRLRTAEKSGHWEGLPDRVEVLGLPKYALDLVGDEF